MSRKGRGRKKIHARNGWIRDTVTKVCMSTNNSSKAFKWITKVMEEGIRPRDLQGSEGLAQLDYLLPRLTRHWSHLSRIGGGGVGTRGPGETQLEVELTDAWVWDMYRPSRFVPKVTIMTFRDVNIEQLPESELETP